MRTSIRPARTEDLGQILRLWSEADEPGFADALTGQGAADLVSAADTITLVAETDHGIIGVAVGTVAGTVGAIQRLHVASNAGDDVASGLLDHLEAHLAEGGARTLTALVPEKGNGRAAFTARGYVESRALHAFERDVPATIAGPTALAQLGARMIDPGLWTDLRGMEAAKEIIERRVILPLARPELAARHAVSSPRAIVLFGPPGTGKTTFAKGIASRLGWPFIEIAPSELAGGGTDRQAKELAEIFDRIMELPAATVFVDEVEDIASIRHEERRTSPSVTNEFLKQIPRAREAPHHLLVCATNWVSRLDPAFLRPGRFDYVLPVGPPDDDARRAIWERYTGEITDESIDIGALVAATDLFTAADIEWAARRAAQRAFEREHFEGIARRADTDEFLTAISETKPTLTKEMIRDFEDDTQRFGRL